MFRTTLATVVGVKAAVAAAPEPPPPERVTVGTEVYPLPGLVRVNDVTLKVAVNVAVALAPVPAPPVIVTVGGAV